MDNRKPLVAFDVLLEYVIAGCEQLRAEIQLMERAPNGDLVVPRRTRGDPPAVFSLIAEILDNVALCNGWRPAPADLTDLLRDGVTFEQAIPFENPTIRDPLCRLFAGLPRFFGDQLPVTLPAGLVACLDDGIATLKPVLVRWRLSAVGRSKHLVADAPIPVDRSQAVAAAELSEPPNEFRRDGDAWVVRFEGQARLIKDFRGMEMLAKLLESEGSGVSSVVLDGTAVVPGVEQEVMDDAARKKLRAKIEALCAQRSRAAATEDADLDAAVDANVALLTKELRGATGLGGRARKLDPETKRVCNRVGDALNRTIEHLKKSHPKLGEHLDRFVAARNGMFPVYRPDAPKPVWFVSWD